MSVGIPTRVLEGESLLRLLFVLYTRFAQLDVDEPAREKREKKIQQSKAAEQVLRTFRNKRERLRLIGQLRGWCRRHGEVARLRGLKKSGVQRFADVLGVRADLLVRRSVPERRA